MRAEGESGKQNRSVEVVVYPVQRRADVVLFSLSLVELPIAQTAAAKVEPHHRQPKGGEGLHRVVDDLIVHRAAAQRMRTADQRGIGSVLAASIQHRLKAARTAAKKLDRPKLR